MEQLNKKLDILKKACTRDDEMVKEALMHVVPTFRRPEEVNGLINAGVKPDAAGKAQRNKVAVTA